VPTLVWNPLAEASWRGRSFTAGSSAPYLTEMTGMAWSSIAELSGCLDDAIRHRARFRPREWVLTHMTDAICAERLLKTIKAEAARIGLINSS
jgi:hypothetical protein